MAKEVVVTREGYNKLEQELENLRTVKRKEVADKIKVARGYGYLSENAEYDAAKEEQASVEARIADLEATLKLARIMDESELSNDTASIGMHVKILAEGDDLEDAEEYDLTGLMDYPILANAGCFAVQETGDAAALKTAESAALWLYSSGDGEKALTDTLGVITPWNTASDNTTLGAMQVAQVNTGILPGIDLPTAATAQALTENEQSLQGGTRGKAERTAFTQAALAALGAE